MYLYSNGNIKNEITQHYEIYDFYMSYLFKQGRQRPKVAKHKKNMNGWMGIQTKRIKEHLLKSYPII